MADDLPDIATGKALVVPDPADDALSELSGLGIPVRDNTGVRMRTGANGDEIILPDLKHLGSDQTFPYVIVRNEEGVFMALEPNETGDRFVLVSENGSFKLVLMTGNPCFAEGDICECQPDFSAGFQEIELPNGDKKYCLVRFTSGEGVDEWQDTNTVDIAGAGIIGNPYKANVKRSALAGNALQLLPDGLYVAFPTS